MSEQVRKFKYLGFWIVNALNNDVEIKTRIKEEPQIGPRIEN